MVEGRITGIEATVGVVEITFGAVNVGFAADGGIADGVADVELAAAAGPPRGAPGVMIWRCTEELVGLSRAMIMSAELTEPSRLKS